MTAAKLCGGAILALMVLLLLRQMKPEFASLAGMGASVWLTAGAVALAAPALQMLFAECKDAGVGSYSELLLKIMGVGMLTQTTADICRDAGESGLADKVELVGKAGILAVSTPILHELLSFAKDVLLSS